MSNLEQAREALAARMGKGARSDAPEAPAADLLRARLGTAYFARKLNELADAELYGPSARAGWTRAHVICDIAYHARAISLQIEAATDGLPVLPLYGGASGPAEDIALGATLPPRALRHLFDHSAIHLHVVWRDLPGPAWQAIGPGEDQRARPLSRTPIERARRLWHRAIDLNNGARWRDVPAELRP